MIDVIKEYQALCAKHNIHFGGIYESVLSYDDSTLFCPAGMQRFKDLFGDPRFHGQTCANIQKCLRTNDIDEISDGIHALAFDMIGLFGFHSLSVKTVVDFFLEYVNILGIQLSYVTVHPDKADWKDYYPSNLEVRLSEDCVWSDGSIGGYCTEFFVIKDGKDIEIGNIVNPLGHSIDVGFGKERLEYILGHPSLSANQQLEVAARSLVNSGILPGPNRHGYVLRSILRKLIRNGHTMDDPIYHSEFDKFKKNLEKYNKLVAKFPNMSDHWWWDTHGIKVSEMT